MPVPGRAEGFLGQEARSDFGLARRETSYLFLMVILSRDTSNPSKDREQRSSLEMAMFDVRFLFVHFLFVHFLFIHFLFVHFLATAAGLFLTLCYTWQDQALNYELSPKAGFPLAPNPVHPPADVDFCPCSGWETAELFLVLGFRKARGPSGSSVILHTSIFKLFLCF